MKKLLLLFLLVSFTSNAQLREKHTIEIIPEIGYSSAAFLTSDNYISSLNSIHSANFGIAADYYFSNRWSLRSGLLFQPMGGGADKLNYLNIPIDANWHFGSTRKWNLNFGLTPSFLMSAKENNADVVSPVKGTQLGLSFGIGYKLEITKKFSFLFDYQYFFGLTNISKVSEWPVTNNSGGYNLGGVFILD